MKRKRLAASIAAACAFGPVHTSSVRAIQSGGIPLQPKVDLTPKQREVMDWLLQGKTNGEIAQILGISRYSVESRVHNICERLGVPNRTAAVIKMLKSTD